MSEICENLVVYNIGVDAPCEPTDELPALPEIPRGGLVVVSGRAPIWRYAMALHRLHGAPAGAIAVYDPRKGAVVVASHIAAYKEGDVIDVEL